MTGEHPPSELTAIHALSIVAVRPHPCVDDSNGAPPSRPVSTATITTGVVTTTHSSPPAIRNDGDDWPSTSALSNDDQPSTSSP